MFWDGIMGRELVCHFRVPEVVKMSSKKYVVILNDHLSASHAARNSSASAAMGIKRECHTKTHGVAPLSPDNPIENLLIILKQKIYEVVRQYSSQSSSGRLF